MRMGAIAKNAMTVGVPLVSAALVGVAWAYSAPIYLVVNATVDVGRIPAALPTDAPLRLRNTHWFRTAVVESVQPTCGCITVDGGGPIVIGPRSEATASLRLVPRPSQGAVREHVRLSLAGGSACEVDVNADVLPISQGWPDSLSVRPEGQAWVARLGRAHIEELGSVVVEQAGVGPTATVDRTAGVIRFQGLGPPHGGRLAAARLTFQSTPEPWVVWLVSDGSEDGPVSKEPVP